jgi:hypothetical protein
MERVDASEAINPDGQGEVTVRRSVVMVQGEPLPCVSIVAGPVHLHMSPTVAAEVASNLASVALEIVQEQHAQERAEIELMLAALAALRGTPGSRSQ